MRTRKDPGKMAKALQALLAGVVIALIPSPSRSWEESDKAAFIEKMSIVKEQIDRQPSALRNGMSPTEAYKETRKYCLLQSIGIDVIHHYLQMNPGDQEWRDYYNKVRDKMSGCLYVMYEMEKRLR